MTHGEGPELDLLIAGGGPAGLATALYAARAGLRTAVLEPRDGPIDKACGEGLMPRAVRALRELGVPLEGHPIRGIRYLDGAQSVDAPFRHGPGMGVRRTVLHGALREAVQGAGVKIIPERANNVSLGDSCVVVDGRAARYLAIADGLHSPLRRSLGLERVTATGPRSRWGTRQHVAMAPWTDLVEVHWAEQSEAYVTPVGPNLVGIAVLSSVRAPFAQQLAAFPALRARVGEAADASSVRGAGPFRQRTSARVLGRALLVGDASGYVDALTGEGIAVALHCARALVDCVAADDPEAYQRRWLSASRRYRVLTSSLLWARHQPLLARRIVPMSARLPRVFGAAVQQLAS
ncbi:MAG: monooxygenase [Pseudonocardiales bacterium]|nr:monooxygenase [Pseudonocardiales bacterium]